MLIEILKHSVVLKFNNVEKLKTMWKLLKERPIKQGEQWRQRLTARADICIGAPEGGSLKSAPILGKNFLKSFQKELDKNLKV